MEGERAPNTSVETQLMICPMVSIKPILHSKHLRRLLAFHCHLVRKGGITLDLNIGHIHGTRPRAKTKNSLADQEDIKYPEAVILPRDSIKWSVGNPKRTP